MVAQIASKSKAAQKKVQIIARYFIKRNGYVSYLVRSSDNQSTYCTTLNAQGHATGCTCPARKPCYHMLQLEQIEAQRQPQQVPAPAPAEQPIPAPIVTLDQAMAEANNVMGGYDSCKICGFRIKCGRMFCARC